MLEVKDKALREKKVIFWQWHIVDIQWQQAQLWFCEPAPPPPQNFYSWEQFEHKFTDIRCQHTHSYLPSRQVVVD